MVNISQELIDSITRGDVVLVIGMGLSTDAGLPNWHELLATLADRIGLPVNRRSDPLRVAQYYQNQSSRQDLINHILASTDTTGITPTDNHRRLVRLGIKTWVTTNYDVLLEQALREAGERFIKVVSDQDLPYITNEVHTLLKLHGDREQPATIVVTQQDYQTYFLRSPRMRQKLSGLLVDKNFFFIGYDVDDPDFKQILAELAFDLQQHQRPSYAVLFDADDFTLSDLRMHNINVLNIKSSTRLSRSEQLGALLDELIREASNTKHPGIERPSTTLTSSTLLRINEAQRLLEAVRYRILDTQTRGVDFYFLCVRKFGTDTHQVLVSFLDREPTNQDIASFKEAVNRNDVKSGLLIIKQSFPIQIREFALGLDIQCYTLDEFIDQLIDFRPYLERMIEKHKASEIPKFYVPLAANSDSTEAQAPQIFESLESFVDAWLAQSGRHHLSILGDFGSGKTWFCKQYAYLSARRYLADPARNRIPLLITLRDYSRAYSLKQVITDVVINNFKVELPAGYDTFAWLNESGRLLLIFDGFDEMERRISDYRITVDNFWELANVVKPASKVLLTCRTAYFLHHSEERETLLLGRGSTKKELSEQDDELYDHRRFELVHLLDFNDETIRQVLRKRLTSDWERAYSMIQSLPNLRDLASRPVLLDMILKTLPQINEAESINLAVLYDTYVNSLLDQRSVKNSDFIPPQDRLFLIQELAWEMQQMQKLTAPSMPFSEFPEWVMKHLKGIPAEHIPFLARDMRSQSYLVRDDDGNYRFSHKSFLEYFVARKMTSAVTEPNFDKAKAIEIWKSRPLSPETCDFLKHMINDPTVLWRLIRATQGMTAADAGYAGGNAATILGLQDKSFVRARLANTILTGADLRNVDLTEADIRKAYLRQVNMRNCTLQQADLREADLTQVRIGEMGPVEAVMFDPSGEFVISGSADGFVRVWRWITGEQIKQLFAGADVTSINVDSSTITAGVGQNGHIKIWDRESFKLIGTYVGHTGPVWNISHCHAKQCFASGAHDSSIRIWDANTHKQIRVIYRQDRGIWDLCFSNDGMQIAAAGGPKLEVYNAQTGELMWAAPEKTAEFRNAKYSNNKLLAYTTREGGIIIRNAENKHLIQNMKGTLIGPNSITFSHDGHLLAVGSSGPEIKIQIWDVKAGSMLKEINANSSGYIGMIHWETKQHLVSGSSDGLIRIWDMDISSPTFGGCIKTLEAKMNCRRARIEGTKGLDAPAPDGKGTLRTWFIMRGATEWPPRSTSTLPI